MAKTALTETENKEAETLRDDIQKLRDDLASMLSSMSSYSRDKLAETRVRLSAAKESLEGRARDRLQNASQMMRERSHQAMRASRGTIEHRPLTSLAVAFVAGVIIATLLERKKM